MTQTPPPDIISLTTSAGNAGTRVEALLDDGGQTPALRRTLYAIVFFVLIFVAWAIFTQIDELARARGEIQPGGHVQTLQTEEGGAVVKLYVKEGDRVKAGQQIAEFAATNLGKERSQVDIKLGAAAINRERILATLENRKPALDEYAKDFPLLAQQARVTYNTQKALLDESERERGLLSREIAEARDRLRRLEEGAKKGVITQLALSEARQQVTALEERRAGMQGGNTFRQQLSEELARTTESYRELLAEKKALDERQGRSLIKSPVDGVVMNLPQTAEGAVIPAGGVVAEIVPVNQEIVMETMVTPRDIGFVKVGQRASVKIDSFDSARFGAVEGTVRRVAPTSSKLKENGMPFYKVDIALATPYVGSQTHRLMPGMTGEADIATGRKSVMQFLLKPVFLASDTAFHER